MFSIFELGLRSGTKWQKVALPAKYTFWDNGQLVSKLQFLWDKLAILSPIGLKFGLAIILHSNDGQNILEVCISQITAKMAKKV